MLKGVSMAAKTSILTGAFIATKGKMKFITMSGEKLFSNNGTLTEIFTGYVTIEKWGHFSFWLLVMELQPSGKKFPFFVLPAEPIPPGIKKICQVFYTAEDVAKTISPWNPSNACQSTVLQPR